jgi:hypothetical protein
MPAHLTRPLVVPEFLTAIVKLYVAHPVTGDTTVVPAFTLDLQRSVSMMFPGKTARANACALLGDDLFISNSGPTSQCVFKVPDYLILGGLAAWNMFVFTLDGNDYVGLTFDAAANLYVAEGSYPDNQIVRYTGTDVKYPGAAGALVDNYAERMDMGNAGMTSYFANLAFDAAGNLWGSDYLNDRLVAFDAAQLGMANSYHVLSNPPGPIHVANTVADLKADVDHLFTSPEGLAFDADGNLWVANNNDGTHGVPNKQTTLVKIPAALQSAILNTTPGGPALTPQSGIDYFVYSVPNVDNNRGQPPQLGGLQIDRSAGRLYVNEQVAANGRAYDLADIQDIATQTYENDLTIHSTNPGNGGIALVEREMLVIIA